MNRYVVRVDLIGFPAAEHYETLHCHMARLNWQQMFQDSEKMNDVSLTTYIGESALPSSTLASALHTIITSQIWPDAYVLVVQAMNWTLTPASVSDMSSSG